MWSFTREIVNGKLHFLCSVVFFKPFVISHDIFSKVNYIADNTRISFSTQLDSMFSKID